MSAIIKKGFLLAKIGTTLWSSLYTYIINYNLIDNAIGILANKKQD
jgi:hypothetical protein